MSAKTYQRLLQAGLFASLAIVFFVFKGLLFPYITSKQLVFNLLMEVLFVFWLVFILRYPAYRPKRNLITCGLIAYSAAILLSCLVSVNFLLSFWGNAERMLGFFHLLHFLIFYFILITVFRSGHQWRWLLAASVLIAAVVSLLGLFGANVYGSLGNTTYVSGYLIFNLYFALLLIISGGEDGTASAAEKDGGEEGGEGKGGGGGQGRFWRWLWLIPIVVMLFEFKAARTSGAIIGLTFSVLLFVFLLALGHRRRKTRRLSLIVFLLAVLAIAAVFSQARSAWFQNSFLRNLTPEKNTFQTRLISWRGALADFRYHPVFGTGFGNYAIIFDKHFDPKFFNYSLGETYFDRAHNNIIDIASTTGALGLLAYLSIFAAALYYLGRLFVKNGRRAGGGRQMGAGSAADGNGAGGFGPRRNLEILVLVALMAGYFVQNLAVFDSFVTYMGLMLFLGYVYWLYFGREEAAAETGVRPEESRNDNAGPLRNPAAELLVLFLLLAGIVVFNARTNLRDWRMFKGVIDGYAQIVSGQTETGFTTFRSALVGTPLDRDGRTALINLVISSPDIFNGLSAATAASDLDYVIALAQANVAPNPQDSLAQMQLAQILDAAARYYYDDLDKFNYYSARSLNAIDAAIESSPGRVPLYLIKAQMLLIRGQKDEAIASANYAISLNPDYAESYCRLTQFYMLLADNGGPALADNNDFGPVLDKCVDLGGGDGLNSDYLLQTAINYFLSAGDYGRAVKFSERLAAVHSYNGQLWLNLAELYFIGGRDDDARAALAKAEAINPLLGKNWNEFMAAVASSTAGKKE